MFTGGIGQHNPEIRNRILEKLAWAEEINSLALPAQEEAIIIAHRLATS